MAPIPTQADAFVELLRQHDERLRRLAARLLVGRPDLVDDVLQDAYASAYRALPRFRGDADVGTWLYRITYNACVDELRRARRRPEPVDLELLGDQPASEPDVATRAVTRDLAVRALASLPLDQRAAVVLIDGDGFDVATAAAILGVPRGTVASRVSRGRAHIRRFIGKDDA